MPDSGQRREGKRGRRCGRACGRRLICKSPLIPVQRRIPLEPSRRRRLAQPRNFNNTSKPPTQHYHCLQRRTPTLSHRLLTHDTDRIHSLHSAYTRTHDGVRHSGAAALRSRAVECASAIHTRRGPGRHMEQQVKFDVDRRCTHHTTSAQELPVLMMDTGLLRPQGRATD
jgi:hypothetical protein